MAYHELEDSQAWEELGKGSRNMETRKPRTLLKEDRLQRCLQKGAAGNDLQCRKGSNKDDVGALHRGSPWAL